MTYAFLRMAIKQAVKWNLITRDPTASIDKAPTSQPRPGRAFTQEEALRFTQAVRGDPLEALYLTTLSLGLRRGEALGLMWADLDERRSEIHIRRQLQTRGGKTQAQEPKTRSSARSVFVPPFLLTALQEHKRNQAGRSVYMFTVDGRPLSPGMFYMRFRKVCKAAGLATGGLHDLRRTAASLLYANGVDLLTISRILGHTSPAITAKLYAKTYEEQTRAASTKIEDIFGAG
jgi:integrase